MATRSKPRTIDEYLAGVAPGPRAALERLRRQIRSAAPRAEECISYGIPALRLDGVLVGFAAASRHCSFFPWSGHTVAGLADELSGFDTSKGTIRFQPDAPLPAALVRRIVRARIAENRARVRARK